MLKNTYKSYPNEKGYFGQFGGRYVSETLMPLIIEVEKEYEKFKIASENIANLPRVDRDFFTASAALPEFSKNHKNSFIKNVDFAEIFSDINSRPKFDKSHKIEFLQLSTEDRVRKILEFLKHLLHGF